MSEEKIYYSKVPSLRWENTYAKIRAKNKEDAIRDAIPNGGAGLTHLLPDDAFVVHYLNYGQIKNQQYDYEINHKNKTLQVKCKHGKDSWALPISLVLELDEYIALTY